MHGHLNVVQWLVNERANASAVDSLGQGALHHAVLGRNPCVEMLEYLKMKAPEMVNVVAATGETPLSAAVERERCFQSTQATADHCENPVQDLPAPSLAVLGRKEIRSLALRS